MGNVFRFETLDSTNTKAILLAREGVEEAVVTARRQTGGRGRLGRRFESPKGGLYLSRLTSRLRPGEQVLAVTPAAALAVRRSIQRIFGASCQIKYPNDLILNGRKVCGILCESLSLPDRFCLVIGVGINVCSGVVLPEGSPDPPPDYPPGSLKEVCESAADPRSLQELEADLSKELDALVEDFASGRGLNEAEYRAHCINCPETIIQF